MWLLELEDHQRVAAGKDPLYLISKFEGGKSSRVRTGG
jgi:hypothetical protein